MWDNYTRNTNSVRTVVKILFIIFICLVALQNYIFALFLAFLFIFFIEYDYHNELDKKDGFQSINKSEDSTEENRLHNKQNKYDYFVSERNIASKPSGGVDKKLFNSNEVNPYGDNNINFYNY